MQKQYNVTFSVNREYLLFMCVTLYSLLKNNQKHYFNVYVVHNNCLQQDKINDICNRFPLNKFNNFKIHLVDASGIEMIDSFNPIGHWSKEVYFKMFLAELLPNVDKTLLLDTDVIIRGDISDFVDTNIDSYLFYGDNYSYEKNSAINVCAGVMLMNVKLAKEMNIKNDFMKAFNIDKKINEEILINKIYKDKIKLTPHNYIINMYTNNLNEKIKI